MSNARRILNSTSSRGGISPGTSSWQPSERTLPPPPIAATIQNQQIPAAWQVANMNMPVGLGQMWQNPFAMWNPWMSNPWGMGIPPIPAMNAALTSSNTVVDEGSKQHTSQQPTICRENTTIIADIRLALMKSDDAAWTVQIAGNVTFHQCMELIQSERLAVKGKKYVFISLGSNQVYEVRSEKVSQQVHRLMDVIFEKNPEVKVFMLPILPRLFDNEYAKEYIIELNRLCSNAVKRMNRLKMAVKFLSVQNSFIVNGTPDEKCFEKDKLTLSTTGCRKLKHLVFAAAGFRMNSA